MIPDIKKLITGFLIVAAAASSSALILSNTPSRGLQTGAQDGNLADITSPLALDQNAFVPTQSDILSAATENNPQVAAALNDPQNLTANYTDAFLNSISAQNPNGIQADTSGNIQLQTPDVKALSAAIGSNPNLRKVSLPDWAAEAAAQKLNISNKADVAAYNDTLNAAFNKNFVQSGVQGLIGQQDLDPSNFAAIAPPLQSAVSDIAQTQTPAQLANFQKSLVTMLVYEKNMVALGDLAQTDPVKAAIVYEAQRDKYTATLQNFGNEFQKASSKGLLSFGKPLPNKTDAATAFLQSYLGIPTANAQWVTFDPSVFGEFILDMINQVILQILRNTLVAFIQQRVLKWIQGSGAPRFIQQFGTQMVNVAQAQAMSAVASILPNYNYSCPNIGKLLGPTIANLGLTIPTGKQPPQCSLPAVSASQLKNFYNNFNFSGVNAVPGGGWGLYAQILNPNNNYYGAVMQTKDYVNQQSSQAAQTAQTKQIVNQGFTGDEICADGSDPNGTSKTCDDKSTPSNEWICGDGSTSQPAKVCLDGISTVIESCPASQQLTQQVCANGSRATQQMTCDDGTPAYDQSNFDTCADGSEPITTTPGQTTKKVHEEALGGALQLTVNANSITGVLASVATSLLNTVVQAGVTAAVQAGTQGLTSITLSATAGGVSSNGGVAASQPAAPTGGPTLPPTQCFPKNPQCSNGPGGQCTSGAQGFVITFSATGGDGLSFDWAVQGGTDAAGSGVPIDAQPSSAHSSPTFSTFFTVSSTINPSTGLPIVVTFPVTIPVTVTGSDGKSDTCLAVISQ
jgi:hypothetical protein